MPGKLSEEKSSPEELENLEESKRAKDKYILTIKSLNECLIEYLTKSQQRVKTLKQHILDLDPKEDLLSQQKNLQNFGIDDKLKESLLTLSNSLSEIHSRLEEDLKSRLQKIQDFILSIGSVNSLKIKIDNNFKIKELSATEIDQLSLILKTTHELLLNPTKENAIDYLSLAVKIDGAPSKTGLSKAMKSVCKKTATQYYSTVCTLFPPFSNKKAKETDVINSNNENSLQKSFSEFKIRP